MQVRWPLAFLFLLVPLAVLLFRRYKKRVTSHVFIAETSSLQHLPSYQKIQTRMKRLAVIEKVLLVLLLISLVILAARPMQAVTTVSEEKSRDIVLCLDVSGSMTEYVAPALEAMQQIANENPNDRYSIVTFASRGYVVMPLTRDQAAITERINELRTIYTDIENNDNAFVYRTLAGYGTDIGEGILTAVNRFSNLSTYKSRSVILLSDLVQTGGDFDLDSQKYLDKISLLPKYQVNFYVMKINNEDARYANNEIVATGGGIVYDVNEKDSAEAVQSVASTIFRQALNTTDVTSKNVVDFPLPYLFTTLVLLTLWAAVVFLQRSRLQ